MRKNFLVNGSDVVGSAAGRQSSSSGILGSMQKVSFTHCGEHKMSQFSHR
jgi:hypothetical protein